MASSYLNVNSIDRRRHSFGSSTLVDRSGSSGDKISSTSSSRNDLRGSVKSLSSTLCIRESRSTKGSVQQLIVDVEKNLAVAEKNIQKSRDILATDNRDQEMSISLGSHGSPVSNSFYDELSSQDNGLVFITMSNTKISEETKSPEMGSKEIISKLYESNRSKVSVPNLTKRLTDANNFPQSYIAKIKSRQSPVTSSDDISNAKKQVAKVENNSSVFDRLYLTPPKNTAEQSKERKDTDNVRLKESIQFFDTVRSA